MLPHLKITFATSLSCALDAGRERLPFVCIMFSLEGTESYPVQKLVSYSCRNHLFDVRDKSIHWTLYDGKADWKCAKAMHFLMCQECLINSLN